MCINKQKIKTRTEENVEETKWKQNIEYWLPQM
jgi:hypothetical protein